MAEGIQNVTEPVRYGNIFVFAGFFFLVYDFDLFPTQVRECLIWGVLLFKNDM